MENRDYGPIFGPWMGTFACRELHMPSLESLINKSLASDNVRDIVDCIEASFTSDDAQEHELAWALGVVFEKNIFEAFRFMPLFLEKYPKSPHPVRVFYSDLLARQGHYDFASEQARIYLRAVSDSRLIEQLQGKPILQDGVARAWLLLSATYTEAGARSYSKRVLLTGLEYPLPFSWVEAFNGELSKLDEELRSHDIKCLDDRWENFFLNSEGWDYIDNHCNENELLMLKKRAELIKDNFKFNPSFNLQGEILKLVKNDNGFFSFV